MTQITIRQVDDSLADEIRRAARESGDSMNSLLLQLLRRHFQQDQARDEGVKRNDLDRYRRGWIEDPECEAALNEFGKVDADAVVQRLAQRFDSVAAGGRVAVNSVSAPESPAHSVKLIPEPTAESCVIGLGLPAVSRDHPEHTALRIVNQIFGGSASSRLFRELRDKRGLSDGA